MTDPALQPNDDHTVNTGGGTYVEGSVDTGGGTLVGRDQYVTNMTVLTRGMDRLPTRYDAYVKNYLEYYIGTPDQPAPFGGRASDLETLDAWLAADDAPPYATLVAPAGRGKSALLAHWVARLLEQSSYGEECPHIVFFPVSIRFNTNLETVAFSSLAARMAHVYGEQVTQAIDARQYRGVFSDYLRRAPDDGRQVLVVVDGLDEAAGWQAEADLFPLIPPAHLRVVVAARPLAGDADERAWLSRMGWDAPGRARVLTLGGLDRDGVSDVLAQMGNPLDVLAPRMDVVGRMHELSEGDPLLVRLYAEALLPGGEQAAAFTPGDLVALEPGLYAYMQRWFEEQRKLWGASNPLLNEWVSSLLHLCATALGPLLRDDALALAPDAFESVWRLDDAARAINRFVIGDGVSSGYVFSHPRLREYFWNHLSERERHEWRKKFLKYGRDTLQKLEAGNLLPRHVCAYIVRYYGAHLEEAQATDDEVYELICEGWLRAWEWVEGTLAGFLNDVHRAWARARAASPVALGQQVRAALCVASVASVSANLPNELLVACTKAGVISPALATLMARQKPDAGERAVALRDIVQFVPLSRRPALLHGALAAARAVGDERDRARALVEMAPNLPEEERGAVLGEALQLVLASLSKGYGTGALGHLGKRWSATSQAACLSDLGSLSAVFHAAARGGRRTLLGAVEALLPVISQLGGSQVLKEIASSIVDTAQWWP